MNIAPTNIPGYAPAGVIMAGPACLVQPEEEFAGRYLMYPKPSSSNLDQEVVRAFLRTFLPFFAYIEETALQLNHLKKSSWINSQKYPKLYWPFCFQL